MAVLKCILHPTSFVWQAAAVETMKNDAEQSIDAQREAFCPCKVSQDLQDAMVRRLTENRVDDVSSHTRFLSATLFAMYLNPTVKLRAESCLVSSSSMIS